MAAQAIVSLMNKGSRLPTEQEITSTYIKSYDKAYGPTYTVLDILQKVFYTNNGAREAFVELCDSEYVQKVTFDSYLYKKVQGNNVLGEHHPAHCCLEPSYLYKKVQGNNVLGDVHLAAQTL